MYKFPRMIYEKLYSFTYKKFERFLYFKSSEM